MLLTHLPQIAVAERSYGELGFLLTKNKGFLRKDVSQMCVHVRACRMSENVHIPSEWVLKVIFEVTKTLSGFAENCFFFVTLDCKVWPI
jgi:hypothetical protein